MELKPCPFCGGRGKLSVRQMRFIGQNYQGDKKIKMGAQVICNRCKSRGSLFSANVVNPYSRNNHDVGYAWIKEQAIKSWNWRVGNV